MSDGLTIGVEEAEREDVRALLLIVGSWAVDLYPPESRHGLDLAAYGAPEVTLLVAREAGVVLGCGACRLEGDGSAEVKSMFVLPAARGRGIGRAILAAVEDAHRGRITTLRARDRHQADRGDPALRERGLSPPGAVRQLSRRPAQRVHGEVALRHRPSPPRRSGLRGLGRAARRRSPGRANRKTRSDDAPPHPNRAPPGASRRPADDALRDSRRSAHRWRCATCPAPPWQSAAGRGSSSRPAK